MLATRPSSVLRSQVRITRAWRQAFCGKKPSATAYFRTYRTNVRVASYNVLSDALCNSEYYFKTDEEDCDSTVRLERVKKKLQEEIDSNAVLCLQEISREWSAALVPFFQRNGYSYASCLSGGKKNGYMGQCIAWPVNRYDVVDISIKRVADSVEWRRPERTSVLEKTPSLWDRLTAVFTNEPSHGRKRSKFDPWEKARSRHNASILVRMVELNEKKDTSRRPFVVGTYHMPCLFGSDVKCQTMTAHCIMVLQHAQRWSGDDPLVFTGDWNVKPSSPQYELIRNGHLPSGHRQLPPDVDDENSGAPEGWTPSLNHPMRSAYAVANGQEPAFTNYAWTLGQKFAFRATLDYIWISDRWTVDSVKTLPQKRQLKGTYSFPSKEEPSDHLLIGASLSF